MKFNKPAKTFDEQVEILENRGIIIQDKESAVHYLSHLNYYRFGAYWLPFEADHKSHHFKAGVTFEDILNLYIFDRELRLLLLDGIERIEVSLRTQWAYQMAHKHGSHAYLNPDLSNNPSWHQHNIKSLQKELSRSDEVFVHHYKSKYKDPLDMPPVWSVCEVMSLGLLSRFYKSIKPEQTKTIIAKTYYLPSAIVISFIEHLAHVRNICAHHNRLWNRRMTKTMQIPHSSKLKELTHNFNKETHAQRKIYNTLVMIVYLMDIISPNNHWMSKLKNLISTHTVDTRMMGFPDNWQQLSIWK